MSSDQHAPLQSSIGNASAPPSMWQQLLKYAIVGGAAFALDFSVLFGLTEFARFYYVASATIAFCAGLLFNYFLSVRWVFHQRAWSNRFAEFALFAAIGLVGLAINDVLIWSLTEIGGLHYLASKIAAAMTVFFWNFFARRQALFVRRVRVSSEGL